MKRIFIFVLLLAAGLQAGPLVIGGRELDLSGRQDVIVEGQTYSLIRTDRNSKNITIKNCIIENSATLGMYVMGENITVTNCIFRDNASNGIWIAYCKTARIEDCIFTGNGHGDTGDRQAAGVWESTGVTFKNCLFQHGGQGNFALECGGRATPFECSIIDCTILHTAGKTCAVNAYGGSITVRDCTVIGTKPAETGYALVRLCNVAERDFGIKAAVTGCRLIGPVERGIFLYSDAAMRPDSFAWIAGNKAVECERFILAKPDWERRYIDFGNH